MIDQFRARIAAEALDPKGAVRLWFDAVFVYTSGDPDLGGAMITEMTKDKNWRRTASYFVRALDHNPHIFRSYARGATPENDYAMSSDDYEFTVTRTEAKPYPDRDEGEYVKMFVESSGADSPRPIEVQRNARGEYKVSNFSSICSGIRPPAAEAAAKDDF